MLSRLDRYMVLNSPSLPPRSKMLVVTLFAQVQPVFVDLRAEVGGRWELELPKDEEEEDEEEDEDEEVQRKHT